MATKNFLNNINLKQNELQEAVIQNLTSDPPTPKSGQVWFKSDRAYVRNSTANKTIAYVDDVMTPATHNHNDIYYTESEIDTKLNAKQNTITGAISNLVNTDLAANLVLVSDSSGKITVATNVSVTELNYLDGVTSNIQTQINNRIASSEKGAINGVATLGADGKVPSSQLPGYVDDVIEIQFLATAPSSPATNYKYYNTATKVIATYNGSSWTNTSPIADAIYINIEANANTTFRWGGSDMAQLSGGGVALGNSVGTGVATTASAGTGTTAAKIDHVHTLNDSVVTGGKIADGNVTVDKLASNSVTGIKIAANAVSNGKLAQMVGKTIKGNIASADGVLGDVSDILISDLATILAPLIISNSTSLINKFYCPAITVSGGEATWAITTLSSARKFDSKYLALVQIYETATNTIVDTAIAINQTTGVISAIWNSTANITSKQYYAVVVE